jgi:group I intron endonuclease
MKSGVYEIVNLVNGKRYVGSAVRLAKRRKHHFFRLRNGDHANKHLQSSYNKHGREAFKFEVVVYCAPETLAAEEQRRIDSYPRCRLFNIRRQAQSNEGVVASEETRRRMSAAHRGKVFSEDTRRKLSDALAGKIVSGEARRRMAEAKEKPYPSFLDPGGTPHPPGTNLKRFCLQHDLNQGSMRYVGMGMRRQHKGWTLSPKLPT